MDGPAPDDDRAADRGDRADRRRPPADAHRGSEAAPELLLPSQPPHQELHRTSSEVKPWWQDGVIYQIYPRSFSDSNADGIGDLEGIRQRLDYLEWLGVTGLWLNPINPSPNRDWGYDVSDYCDVHPDLGDMATLERLVAEAGGRGIRVLLDIVPNHSSDQHPWFADARSSREARHRDWYVWADGKNGGPPNNWKSVFGGPDLDLPRGDGPVVPAQLPPRAAGPELVDAGGLGVLRRDPALLVRPRHRGLPHRRRPRDRERQGAARRPARPRRRVAPQARLQHEPARDARGLPPVAPDLRGVRPVAAAHGRDPRPRPGRHGLVLRKRRRAPARLQLRVRLRPVRGRAATARRRADRGGHPRGWLACLDAVEPRRDPLPDSLGERRPGQDPLRAPRRAPAARDSRPVLRRRDRAGAAGGGPPSASSTSPATATAPARRCAGRPSPGTASPARVWSPGSRSGAGRTSSPSATTRLRS